MATFQKRGKRWRAIVRRQGISRSNTFATKSAAREWATKIERDIDTHDITESRPPPISLRLTNVIDQYTEVVSRNKPFGRSKAFTLDFLKRELGHLPIAQIRRRALLDFIDRRVSQGAGGVTIGVDLSTLATVLRWARVKLSLDIPLEPIQDAREAMRQDGMTTRSRARDRRPTKNELEALFALWDGNTRLVTPMTAISQFAIATAMRQEEITRLRWEDLDREKKTIIVRDRKDPREKFGNDQVVPLLAANGYDAYQIAVQQPRIGPRIFPFNARSVSSAFTRACSKLKIEDLRFHDLRHEGASRLFEAGYAIEQVALVTGHKDWKMLQRYTQLRAEDLHR
ncbi:MAG: site-specific integrase [Pseudomonadota bacterium]